MKTLIKINQKNERPTVTNQEIIKKTKDVSIIRYLKVVEKYDLFCRNQTKKGQARKNERARMRHKMFTDVGLTDKQYDKLKQITSSIFKQKDAKIKKITVEINYDGRKKSNLPKIKSGVTMAVFTGAISPQYYTLGLIDFKIKK